MPSPCTASSHAISGKAFRWQTRSDHVTRKALAARNNEAYGQGNGRHAVVPYSPSLSLKTLVTGILLLAVFTLKVEIDYPSEASLCTVAPFPTDTPAPIFSEGRGWLYTGYLERIIPSSNCPSKLTDKVRRIVHSKLQLFHFQIKTYYISNATHQTDNLSLTNNLSLVCKRPFLL